MFPRKKTTLFSAALLLLIVVLAACQPAQPETVEVTRVVEAEVTRVVTEEIVVEGETVEVTRVVTEVVEVEPEPEEEVAMMLNSADPTTFSVLTFADVDTLDPNLSYDTASDNVISNVMEPLITYNREDGTSYVPQLATEVPTVENGGISEDGLTYTFNIREGISFHEGGALEPHDVAYSFQRGLIQSDPNSAQWLFMEPVLGYDNCFDITEGIDPECGLAGDRDTLIATATPEQLVAACEVVQEAIVADDAAGTVTFNLAQPWGPFMATMAGSWGTIMDSEWVAEQGGWDGDCATWQNFYAPGSENSELSPVINGTGPYILDHWTPNEEFVLVANPDYWRTDDMPVWEGGPSGQPAIQTVIVRVVPEWGTRFAALQAGDADSVEVPQPNRTQVDQFVGEFCDYATEECQPNPDNPDGPLRKWGDLPGVARADAFMTFDLPEDSPYIGSGQLDGNGIPPDFFNDINVRRAMNYCMDFDTLISDGQNGEGVRNNGPIILGMLGYNPDGPMYEFDLDQCAAELEQAHGGVLPETGFRFSAVYNTGNLTRQTAATILQNNLRAINPNYQVEVVQLPWPTLLRSFRVSQLPMTFSGWVEDIHDPHNWVQPFTVGTYAGRQNLPDELTDQFTELVNAGTAAADPAEREQIYFDLQQLHHDNAIQVTLSQPTETRYEQRWVNDWFYRIGQFNIEDGGYYYAYSKE